MDDLLSSSTKLKELHDELAKTSVISDVFKDRILQLALEAADEVRKAKPGGDAEELRQEFMGRRFKDVSAVKLVARSIAEFLNKFSKDRHALGIVRFLMSKYPKGDWLRSFLLGTHTDVVAVREWLWREMSENPQGLLEHFDSRDFRS
jgi:hypothetical protein